MDAYDSTPSRSDARAFFCSAAVLLGWLPTLFRLARSASLSWIMYWMRLPGKIVTIDYECEADLARIHHHRCRYCLHKARIGIPPTRKVERLPGRRFFASVIPNPQQQPLTACTRSGMCR